MIVKLLTEHHLEFLSLKGICRGSSESTLVKCQIVGNHMLGSFCRHNRQARFQTVKFVSLSGET